MIIKVLTSGYTPIPPPSPPAAMLQDYDNNIYTTSIIGAQEWIVQNLRVTHYANGTAIPNITNDAAWAADVTGAYCEYDNSTGLYVNPYGYLYNWYAADNINGLVYFKRNSIQELGWRMPTETDIDNLITALGVVTPGGKIKEMGTTHWNAPNTNATDIYGFAGLPGGRRVGATFLELGQYGYYFSESLVMPAAIQNFYFYLSYDDATIIKSAGFKSLGRSIRCVKDI
jgi:uncharacterized protein (TIGR02145 family)